ncbi:MAG: sigma 54-interacting transcriptional regulator [Syntrophales bacterium]|nr:sigma 54-interacting transcriptional regulator [Syntrophales bacterium]
MINENELFKQATLILCSSLEPNTTINRFLNYIKDYIPVTEMGLGLLDESALRVRIYAWASTEGGSRPPSSFAVPRAFLHDTEQLLCSNDRFILVDDDSDMIGNWKKYYRPVGKWPNGYSQVSMRIDIENHRLGGGLTLWTKGENQYTDAHFQLLSILREPLSITISNAIKHQETLRLKEMLADDNDYLQQTLLYSSGDTIIGADSGLKGIMNMVSQVAGMETSVLLLGETGVGKEVIANFIQQASPRKAGPFIKVNCGAIPESLMDSELFGHEKGAFTGAAQQKRGRFERANNGTIFLDEIGELSPAAQIRLLRVLQEKEIERVGGTEPILVNVRIISATHRNLEEMVRAGQFREDLWYRLNVFPIMIPPLRQRKEDISSLANHFLERKSREMKIEPHTKLERNELERLMAHDWPGNVRELENYIERALIRTRGKDRAESLRFDDILPPDVKTPTGATLPFPDGEFPSFNALCRSHFEKALRLSAGTIEGPQGAAKLLKLHPNTLRSKLKMMRIPYSKKYRKK